MEKIIKAALAAKYPTASVDALLDVVMGTPNPQIAAEMLLDVYLHPIVHAEPHETCNAHEANKVFINYDKWHDQVNYSYNPRKSKYGWYLKSLPENERYDTCIDGYDVNRTQCAAKLNLTEEEFDSNYYKGHCYGPIDTKSIRTNSCHLSYWNNGNKL